MRGEREFRKSDFGRNKKSCKTNKKSLNIENFFSFTFSFYSHEQVRWQIAPRWKTCVGAEFKDGLRTDRASSPDALVHRQLRMIRLEIRERAQKCIPGALRTRFGFFFILA